MSDLEEGRYEGMFTRVGCPHCDALFDVEGDARDEEVRCDACGERCVVGN